MKKSTGSFLLKFFLVFALFYGLKFSYYYYVIEIMKLPAIPDGIFFFAAVLSVVSYSFFQKVWNWFLRPLITFLVIVPAINKGLNVGVAHFGIDLPPFMKANLYYISFTIAGYFSTFGFFLIKKALWGLLNILFIKPVKMFYGGMDDFFKYVENLFFEPPEEVKYFMEEVDNIQGDSDYERGRIFEELVAEAYNRLGYYAETTGTMREKGTLPASIQKRGGSGEQGVDVMVKIPAHLAGNSTGAIMAVQCKLYKSKVDNKAVQEIVAALPLYGADLGVVVTNNYFTRPAQELAEVNNIQLVDRDGLQKLLVNSYKKAA